MPLQQIIIQKIDAEFGLQPIIFSLKNTIKTANYRERYLLENLIIYYRSLYKIKMCIASDILMYKSVVIETKDLLHKKAKQHQCKHLLFLAQQIEFNLDYTSNIRKLA